MNEDLNSQYKQEQMSLRVFQMTNEVFFQC